jgi:hypothetical protein
MADDLLTQFADGLRRRYDVEIDRDALAPLRGEG